MKAGGLQELEKSRKMDSPPELPKADTLILGILSSRTVR